MNTATATPEYAVTFTGRSGIAITFQVDADDAEQAIAVADRKMQDRTATYRRDDWKVTVD